MQSHASTHSRVDRTGAGGLVAPASEQANSSTAHHRLVSANKLWDTLVAERQGDPAGDRQGDSRRRRSRRRLSTARRAACAGTPGRRRQQPGAPRRRADATFREAASVIANRESGHPHRPRHLAPARESAGVPRPGAWPRTPPGADRGDRRRGAAEQPVPARHRLAAAALGRTRPACRLQPGRSGLEFGQPPPARPRASTPTRSCSAARSPASNFNFALKLLESFGDVRVLSSPKISVLNNQTAVLQVTRQHRLLHDHAVHAHRSRSRRIRQPAPSARFTTTPNSAPRAS